MDYQKINARTIDSWCEGGWEWGKPISHETFQRAKAGEWDVRLTPTKPVPHDWFPDFKNCRLLGLASGGAQQIPVFSALGADCTVLDYSSHQCESERTFARQEGYTVKVLQEDMTKSLPFADGTFDLIFHPVSNCYIEKVTPVFRECYRVLKKGGILLCGLDNGINFIFDESETTLKYRLPFNPLKDPALYQELMDMDSGVQFSHTMTEQIGGQLDAGFRLTHIYEDTSGEGRLHEFHIPSYIATRAIKEC